MIRVRHALNCDIDARQYDPKLFMHLEQHDADCASWFDGEPCDCSAKDGDYATNCAGISETKRASADEAEQRKEADEFAEQIKRKWKIGPRLRRSYHDET
jgi:hypothetical protein